MSGNAERRKIYEDRVLNDALTRLAERVDVKALPFSEEELRTLARRSRDAFRHPGTGRQRLDRYRAHLASIYGTDLLVGISSVLEEINDAIGYEEK